MSNIIVTTPKRSMPDAALEAEDARRQGGDTLYFRHFGRSMPSVKPGDRVYYVEDGFIRGFALVYYTEYRDSQKCDTTGAIWPEGSYVFMRADSWQWIEPIPMQGFQNFRYIKQFVSHDAVKVVGGWLDPKPEVTAEKATVAA